MPRRGLLITSVAIGYLTNFFACYAGAQGYPNKPVRLLVASSAGSNPDTLGRVVAGGLTQVFGQQVIVDNRAGAAGNIGAELGARGGGGGPRPMATRYSWLTTTILPTLRYTRSSRTI